MQLKKGRRGWDFQSRRSLLVVHRHLSIFKAPLDSLPKQHMLQPPISYLCSVSIKPSPFAIQDPLQVRYEVCVRGLSRQVLVSPVACHLLATQGQGDGNITEPMSLLQPHMVS